LRRLAAILVVAMVLMIGLASPAFAEDPELTVTGEPTEEEFTEIETQWFRFLAAFDGLVDCLEPLEVRVVDRAEDWYHAKDVGPIAAFYVFPPDPMIYIEHRKVVPSNLLHEMAHHLDVSCSLAEGSIGDAFRIAQGIGDERGWFEGGTWSAVPAEAFAEAVVEFFGEPTQIDISSEAVRVIEAMTRVADAELRARDEQRVAASVPGTLLFGDMQTLQAVPGGSFFAF